MRPEDEEVPPNHPLQGWREFKVGPCCAKQLREHVIRLHEDTDEAWTPHSLTFHQAFHFCGLLLFW